MPTGPRPAPPTRNCRLVFSGHYGGAPWVNVMWLFLTGSGEITVPDLNALATACRTKYVSRFLPELRTEVELQSTQVFLYSGGDVLEGIDSGIATGGTSTGVASPANVAVCVSWKIAPSYRGGHPRTYLAGIPTSSMASVITLNAGVLASLRSRAHDFHADLEAIGPIGSGITTVEHGVVSFVRAGEWRTPPVFYRITASDVDGRLDSQRRRLGPDFP